jgi:hypothetical protein
VPRHAALFTHTSREPQFVIVRGAAKARKYATSAGLCAQVQLLLPASGTMHAGLRTGRDAVLVADRDAHGTSRHVYGSSKQQARQGTWHAGRTTDARSPNRGVAEDPLENAPDASHGIQWDLPSDSSSDGDPFEYAVGQSQHMAAGGTGRYRSATQVRPGGPPSSRQGSGRHESGRKAEEMAASENMAQERQTAVLALQATLVARRLPPPMEALERCDQPALAGQLSSACSASADVRRE